jgi:hypothetical protein
MAQVDERTTTMSAEALACRSFGHAPYRAPIDSPERVAYKRKGQQLVVLGCRNQCGYERRIVLDRGTKEVISSTTKYADPKSYLSRKTGGGRIPRQESRRAFFAVLGED